MISSLFRQDDVQEQIQKENVVVEVVSTRRPSDLMIEFLNDYEETYITRKPSDLMKEYASEMVKVMMSE